MLALMAEALLAGVVAGLAPTAMAGLLTLLASARGVRGGLWYAAGYAVFTVVFMVVAATALHGATYGSARIHELIGGAAEVLLGVALTAGAVGWFLGRRSRGRSHRRVVAEPKPGENGPSDRLAAWMARLDRLPWIACFGLGLLLSVTRVRNIITTLVVANAATGPGISLPEGILACCVFLLLALGPVWLPLLLYRWHRARGGDFAASFQAWLTAHGTTLATVVIAVFGGLLIAHGASQMAGLTW